jgi:heme/copper-type cytochrome/quinol oxidase subunit 2
MEETSMVVEIVAGVVAVLVVLILSVAAVRVVRAIAEAGPDADAEALRTVVDLVKVLRGKG